MMVNCIPEVITLLLTPILSYIHMVYVRAPYMSYMSYKGSFSQEPYISQITNRNQRAWLSRYQTSAHSLRVELGRYINPVTPLSDPECVYCIDTEKHFILFW